MTASQTQTVTGLIEGTYIFTYTTDNPASTDASCQSNDQLTVTVANAPSATILTPDNTVYCGGDPLIAQAATPTFGTGSWSFSSKPSGVSDPGFLPDDEPLTNLINIFPGNYTFVWTVDNGVCGSISTTIDVSVFPTTTQALAGTDQLNVVGNSVTLAGNSPASGETGVWTISGPGAPSITNANSPTTTLTNLSFSSTYTLTWTITNGGNCPTSDDVIISTTTAPSNTPPVVSVPLTQTVCQGASLTLDSGTPNNPSVSDVDGDDQNVTITVSNGTLNLDNSGGAVITNNGTASISASGTLAQINDALDGSVFIPSPGFSGTATIEITTNDGNGGTDTDSFAIIVNQNATISTVTVADECQGTDVTVDLAGLLPSTSVTVTYNVSGANTIGSTTVSISADASGDGSFTIPSANLPNTGNNTVTITMLELPNGCTITVNLSDTFEVLNSVSAGDINISHN